MQITEIQNIIQFFGAFFFNFLNFYTRKKGTISRREKLNKFEGKMLIINVLIVLKRHYPRFDELLNAIPDHRKRSTYQVGEIIMAGLSMFIFKRTSRNHTDNGCGGHFEHNYITLFGMRLPIMETVDEFLRQLPPEEMERLKKVLVQQLLERKVLEKWKYDGRYNISVDGSGLFTFDHKPYEGCPYTESKNGKVTWHAYVVEAKIICSNGFNISIASEWLQNSEDVNAKQDCEQKAFARLASKIKALYPRLPVIITADSLYPNQTVFDICKANNWDYIFVLKEGSLKSVWQEINSLYPLQEGVNAQERVIEKKATSYLKEKSMFINDIDYHDHNLSWVEYKLFYDDSKPHRYFAHITNMNINWKNVWDISSHGRMRWTIENQGFNTQKNGGYSLQHKYSRKYLWAMKNYYELLQIAHMINQLTEQLNKVKAAIKQAGHTIKSITEDVISAMKKQAIEADEIQQTLRQNKQLRY